MSKTTFVLIVILSAAAFLRFYQIDTNPKAMYGDSLTGVYDAYSIYKTGHDQKGNFLPLVFSLGGGRPGGYIYASVPFAALFGPTALASRMVSVLSGIGIVFLLYLLGKKLFSINVGLVIAAIAALNPWELSLSRGPFESHFALFLTLLGFYFFILGFKKSYWFLVFGLSFFLASQTYSTYRLTIPLLTMLLLVWMGRKEILKHLKKKLFILSLFIIASSLILSIYLTLSRGKEDRFDIINIFKDPAIRHSISQKVKSERLLDNLSPTLSYKLHTTYLELGAVLVENYLGNFFPDFLFLHGDGSARHNPAEMGQLLWIDAVLLLLGLIYLYQTNKKLLVLLAGWVAVAPIPTSLVGGPHGLRSSLLLPPLLILAGLGLMKLWGNRSQPRNAAVLVVLGFVFLFQYVLFSDKFYLVAPKKQARFWSISAKEAFILAEKNRQKFDFIILSNDIDNMEFAYPTYAKLDPGEVMKQNQSPAKIGEFKFFKYGNIHIGSLPNTRVTQFIKDLPGSALYIGASKEQPYLENYKIIRGFDNEVDLVVVAKGATPDLYIDEH